MCSCQSSGTHIGQKEATSVSIKIKGSVHVKQLSIYLQPLTRSSVDDLFLADVEHHVIRLNSPPLFWDGGRNLKDCHLKISKTKMIRQVQLEASDFFWANWPFKALWSFFLVNQQFFLNFTLRKPHCVDHFLLFKMLAKTILNSALFISMFASLRPSSALAHHSTGNQTTIIFFSFFLLLRAKVLIILTISDTYSPLNNIRNKWVHRNQQLTASLAATI